MGFFDLFRRNKLAKKNSDEKKYPLMPTVEVPQQLSAAFDKAFFDVMAMIEGLSKTEKNEIHKIIASCKGGHLSQGDYYNLVYDKYFKDRNWSWGEFEKWQSAFDKIGEYPSKWPRQTFEIDDRGILRYLRVSDIKGILASIGAELPSKVRKDDLINYVMSNQQLKHAVLNCQEAKIVREKFLWDKNREVYALLIRTISGRARSRSDEKRQADLGMRGMLKRELVMISEEDRKFVDMALAENPNASPPFFPGDVSMYISRIAINGDETT